MKVPAFGNANHFPLSKSQKIINGGYYANLLDQFDVRISEKRPGLEKKKKI